MIRTSLSTFVVIMAFNTVASTQSNALDTERPVLKAEAVVTDDVVRVGDLVAHAGIIAKVPIFRAPDLGSTGTVSAVDVAEAVRGHALIGLDTGGITEVRVTRAARVIPAQEIENAIVQSLAARYNLGDAKDLSVALDRDLQSIYVPPNVRAAPQVEALNYDPASGRFSGVLKLPQGNANYGMLRIYGRAQITSEIITVAHQVERGATLKSTDIVVERRPRAQVNRDTLTARDQVIGMAARTTLVPGRVLRSSDLAKPDLVQGRQAVTLIYQGPGITLTARGKAAESGAMGDSISVTNEQTKRTVQGTIIGAGRVLVGTSPRQLASNSIP
jgi:flagella basal body P-ring formation protein FlgA